MISRRIFCQLVGAGVLSTCLIVRRFPARRSRYLASVVPVATSWRTYEQPWGRVSPLPCTSRRRSFGNAGTRSAESLEAIGLPPGGDRISFAKHARAMEFGKVSRAGDGADPPGLPLRRSNSPAIVRNPQPCRSPRAYPERLAQSMLLAGQAQNGSLLFAADTPQIPK